MKKYLLVSIMFVLSCSGGKKLMNKNLAYIYYNDPTIIHPDYGIYHVSDSTTMLYFRINSKEALYSKKPKDSIYSAELSLHFNLYKLNDSKTIIDSATIHLIDSKGKEQHRYLSGKMKVDAGLGFDYYMELTLYDKIRDQKVQNYQLINKQNRSNRQNFLVTDDKGRFTFRNHYNEEEDLTIRCNQLNENGKLHVRYYRRNFDLPAPPFSSTEEELLEYEADSLFEVAVKSDSTFDFNLNRKGFYHFLADTSERYGLTLFNFKGGFPEVNQPEDMLEPIRFLTTSQEFRNLKNAGANKETIDDFWFNVAGSRDRGRAIIKEYYSRVEEANQFFTSYLEGWKTDRGMIYTIYGPPNVIYKTLESENWIYGEQNNVLSVNFTFYKVENPFTNNDFYLSRSPVYRSSWYRAVDSWRQGKVY